MPYAIWMVVYACAVTTGTFGCPLHLDERPYADFDDLDRCTRMRPDCSVCSEGYATTVANACSKCSDGKGAAIVVVLAIAVLVALGLLWHMVAIEQDGRPQGVVVRVWKVLPLQAIKIVTVAWQIVTQVRIRNIQNQHFLASTFPQPNSKIGSVRTALAATSHHLPYSIPHLWLLNMNRVPYTLTRQTLRTLPSLFRSSSVPFGTAKCTKPRVLVFICVSCGVHFS